MATPIGYMPTPDAIDITGLNIGQAQMEELLRVDKEKWLQEVASIREYYARFGEGIPKAMIEQLDALERRLLDYEE